MDANVGQVPAAPEEAGAADNTAVVFTSGNGAWFDGGTGGRRSRKACGLPKKDRIYFD